MKRDQTEVLVVGAGPVGLLTAILLAEHDIQVQIIDSEAGTAARSYACALHPATLRLLDRLGLAATVLEHSHRISKMVFYESDSRCVQINLSEFGGDCLVLPQNVLEDILEQRLRQKNHLSVNWNHRFDRFQSGEDEVVATVEKLEGTAMGYIVPHWETMVKKSFPVRTQFLVGADGHNSIVRQRLGIDYDRVAGPQGFVACEFTSDSEPNDELRVVLDEATTNVLWPLPGGKYRWTFQLIHSESPHDFPEKDRIAVRSGETAVNEKIRHNLQRLIHHRAPWFSASIKEILWCKQVAFQHRLAKKFGRDRCWLAGDAAHQTGPVGVQSLNVGLSEADALAGALQKVLRAEAPLDSLAVYDQQRQTEWRRLLGLGGGLRARIDTTAWVRSRCSRILPCLPASGEDVTLLANQLGLDFVS